LPLIGLAFFKAAWNKARVKGELLLLSSLTPVAVFLLFFIQDRYIATLLPTLTIWLASGAYELGVWLRGTTANLLEGRELRRFWQSALLAIPVIALLLFFAVLQPRVIQQYTNIGSFRPEHKTIGLWLRDNISSDSVVMSRYPAIAFYADTRWEPTPNAEYGQVLDYARYNAVDYFVLDESETRDLRPQLAFLLAEGTVPPELELIHADYSAGGKLVVFRLK